MRLSTTFAVLLLVACSSGPKDGLAEPLTGTPTGAAYTGPPAPQIELNPEVLDFEEVGVGCEASLDLTVKSVGTYPLEVLDIEIVDDSDGVFDVTWQPAVIPTGGARKFAVTLTPFEHGSWTARLRVKSDDSDDAIAPADLIGASAADPIQVDLFEQPMPPKLDMLFVLDRGSDSEDAIDSLMLALPTATESLITGGVDFHLGTINMSSTDPTQQGRLQGSIPVVDPNTPNAGVQIAANIALYAPFTDGAAFDVAGAALSEPLISTDNAGFLRPDAVMAVVAWSAQDDDSQNDAPTMAALLDGLHGDPALAHWSTVSGPTGFLPCTYGGLLMGTLVDPAPRLANAASLTDGLHVNMCDYSAAASLAQVITHATGLLVTFPLSKDVVDQATIEVDVDGVSVIEDPLSGWIYDEVTNAIAFGSGRFQVGARRSRSAMRPSATATEANVLTIEEALARVLVDVPLQPVESVPLHESHGRLLAADLVSPRDIPGWDNSSMDGYALRAEDTSDGEVVLRLNEVIAAGSTGTIRVESGTASAIMTGAPVPEGADAVVMVEKTDGAREGQVRIRGRATEGHSIRRRGLDVEKGDVVLREGVVLTAGAIGLVASLGMAVVPVRRRPVVAILSTGDEVVMPGVPLGPGQIYSSNNFALAGLIREAGAIVKDCGNAPDDLDGLVEAFRRALVGADVLCTTGGVSVGAFDCVKEAHEVLGASVDFWRVRMKPGKPLAFGRLGAGSGMVPLFGLPGNPVSCMVNFLQYVRPWIRMTMGDPTPWLPVVDAVAGQDFSGQSNRARFERVMMESTADGWIARSTGSQSSGVLTSMARAHGLLLIGIDAPPPQLGDRVRVQLLDPGFLDGTEPDFGW